MEVTALLHSEADAMERRTYYLHFPREGGMHSMQGTGKILQDETGLCCTRK